MQALQKQAKLSEEISKIYAYARLQLDADNTDPALQAMSGEAESLLADFNNAVSFVEPEIISLSKDYLESCLADPSFNEFKFYLANCCALLHTCCRRSRKHCFRRPALQCHRQLLSSAALSAPIWNFRPLPTAKAIPPM